MPKMKTKSGAKKRFKLTGTGKVKAAVAYKRHMFSNKPKKMRRQSRGTFVMNESDAKVVLKHFLPNARA